MADQGEAGKPLQPESTAPGTTVAGAAEDGTGGRPWLRFYPPGVRARLEYPDIPLHGLLERAARERPGQVAIIFFNRRLTYAELDDAAGRFARVLADLGVRPGDRVALMLPNCPQFVIAYYGALKAGAIVVNHNPLYTARELEFQLNDAGCETIVALDMAYKTVREARGRTPLKRVILTRIHEYMPPLLRLLYPLKAKRDGTWTDVPAGDDVLWFQDLLARAAGPAPGLRVDPDEVALLQYTGGTTGRSKGAMLTHRNLLANALQAAEWLLRGRMEDGPRHRILGVIPFFHVYGMTTVMNLGIAIQGTMILLPRFTVEDVLRAVNRYKPTMFPGVPTMYVAVLNHPDLKRYDFSSIESCVSGAAPLPLEVQERFEQLTGGSLVEGYGLTEASPVTHVNPTGEGKRNGTIGVPLPDTDARIVDIETGTKVLGPGEVGELCVRGPQVMKGYWNRPEENERALRDGWLYTGDIATMDEDGFFRIVDRKKEMIITGGYNVYPREVEEVLYQHPKVLEAAVVGVPDEYRGEMVKAFVVLKPGETATEEEIIAYCRERLAKYKAPRAVEFRTELPKSLVGKVLRRVLAEEERKRRQGSASPGRNGGGNGR